MSLLGYGVIRMHIIDSASVRMSTKPKKAGGAKGKKGKKVKKGEKGEQDLEERYKRTLHEITSLRVELGKHLLVAPDIPSQLIPMSCRW